MPQNKIKLTYKRHATNNLMLIEEDSQGGL